METRRCGIDDIDLVFEEFIENPYTQEVRTAVKNGVRKTARDMAKETRKEANADQGWEAKGFPNHRAKKHGGSHGVFRKHITWRGEQTGVDGYKATWYVRSPEHRLTHLLVGGHKLVLFGMKTGKHTSASDWLDKAQQKADSELVENIKKELNK